MQVVVVGGGDGEKRKYLTFEPDGKRSFGGVKKKNLYGIYIHVVHYKF